MQQIADDYRKSKCTYFCFSFIWDMRI